ncbi:hypothetical protein [Variovorax sp. GB1P17]|uniref:hypothetical protein n=1 Tax=Variovorax sp. GB1P17 TaxID=3443740 RepID=UPI003F47D71E
MVAQWSFYSILLAAMLTACGGGGGGGFPSIFAIPSSPEIAAAQTPNSPSNPMQEGVSNSASNLNPDTTAGSNSDSEARPMAITPFSYKFGAVNTFGVNDILAELNSPEMVGFLPFELYSDGGATSGKKRRMYEKRAGSTAFDHRFLPRGETDVLFEMRKQGAEGYSTTWVLEAANSIPGTNSQALYSKVVGQNTKYEYEEVDVSNWARRGFLESLNEFGQKGYCQAALTRNEGRTVVLEREVPGASRCSFTLKPGSREMDDRAYIALLAEEGKTGGKLAMQVGAGSESRLLFVRDESQQATFRYDVEDVTSMLLPESTATLNDWAEFFNRKGASGALPYISFTESGRTYRVFVTAFDCSGALCKLWEVKRE